MPMPHDMIAFFGTMILDFGSLRLSPPTVALTQQSAKIPQTMSFPMGNFRRLIVRMTSSLPPSFSLEHLALCLYPLSML